MYALFTDRRQAGRVLAQRLRAEAGTNTVVLALPRGGVPVGFEVASALGAEFDVLPVRKIGVPGQEELAMGAIASGGALYVEHETLKAAGVSQSSFDAVLAHEQVELARREALYRGARPPTRVEGRTVFVVDDGIATGATMKAAALALRARRPGRLIVGVPVAPAGVEMEFADIVDAFVCVEQPALFFSVGQCYERFGETTDDEVRTLLEIAWNRRQGAEP